MKIEDFNNTQPEFIPEIYFSGRMSAYGVVKNRKGTIIRSFKGEMIGFGIKGVGTLKEKFIYDDKEESTRTWKLIPTGDKSYDATAEDIVGVSKMIANGNSVMLDYIMTIPYKKSKININVQDWLHLQEDGVIINHSKMKKFGFVVGELVITIIKDFPQQKN